MSAATPHDGVFSWLPRMFAADHKERVMDRNYQQRDDDLIDLGAVSAETKGPPLQNEDTFGGIVAGGISND
jgi:hypothetical protein